MTAVVRIIPIIPLRRQKQEESGKTCVCTLTGVVPGLLPALVTDSKVNVSFYI